MRVKPVSEDAGLFLTKVMAARQIRNFRIDENEVEIVESFSFLGTMVKNDGSLHVRQR